MRDHHTHTTAVQSLRTRVVKVESCRAFPIFSIRLLITLYKKAGPLVFMLESKRVRSLWYSSGLEGRKFVRDFGREKVLGMSVTIIVDVPITTHVVSMIDFFQ